MRLILLIILIVAVRADWWDFFTDSVSSGINRIAGWVKDTASPAIRGTFNDAKEKLQDPETHKAVQDWLSEKAAKVADFTNEEVVPELVKIYEAAKAAAQERSSTSSSVEVE